MCRYSSFKQAVHVDEAASELEAGRAGLYICRIWRYAGASGGCSCLRAVHAGAHVCVRVLRVFGCAVCGVSMLLLAYALSFGVCGLLAGPHQQFAHSLDTGSTTRVQQRVHASNTTHQASCTWHYSSILTGLNALNCTCCCCSGGGQLSTRVTHLHHALTGSFAHALQARQRCLKGGGSATASSCSCCLCLHLLAFGRGRGRRIRRPLALATSSSGAHASWLERC